MNKFEIPKSHANKLTTGIQKKSGPFGFANSYIVKSNSGMPEEVTISHRLGLRGRTSRVRITDMDSVEREGRQVRPFVQMEVRNKKVILTTGSTDKSRIRGTHTDSQSIIEPHRVTLLRDLITKNPKSVAAMLEKGVSKAEPKSNRVIKIGPWRGETVEKRRSDKIKGRLVQ